MQQNDWKLIVRRHDGPAMEISLDPAKSYRIGRKEADIILEFEQACSRHHATLTFAGSAWKLIDEMSTNGTMVGDHKVNFALMEPGICARIGKTRLEIASPHAAPSRSPGSASGAHPSMPGAPGSGRLASAPTAAARQPLSGKSAGLEPPKRSKAPIALAMMLFLGALAAAVYVVVSGKSKPEEVGPPPKPTETVENLGDPVLIENFNLIAAIPDEEAERRAAQLEEFRVKYSNRLAGTALTARVMELEGRSIDMVDAAIHAALTETERALATLRAENRYRAAAERLDDDERALRAKNALWQSRADRLKVRTTLFELRQSLISAGGNYFDTQVRLADELAGAGKVEDAILVLERLLETVALTDFARGDLGKRIGLLRQPPPERDAPEKDETDAAAAADIGGKLRGPRPVDLPAFNPLLPEGEASEKAALVALRGRIRADIEAGKLRDRRWSDSGGGKRVEILRVGDKGVYVADSQSGIERLVPWERVTIDELSRMLTGLKAREVGPLLGCALTAFERGEMRAAARLLAEIHALDGNLKRGIDILLAQRRNVAIPDGGFIVFEGELMLPRERETLLLERTIEGLVAVLEKGLGRATKKQKEQGEAAFTELLDLGDPAVGPAIVALQKRREALLNEAETSTGLTGDTVALKALKQELNKRRQAARALIFNETRWPYPYAPDNDKVTAEVMALVDAVREVWRNPAAIKGKSNPKFDELLALLIDVNERMDRIDPAFSRHQSTSETDTEYLRTVANRSLDVRNVALDGTEKQLIVYNDKVMKENADQRVALADKPGMPDAEAWEQLRITNEYRIMMGVRALKMNVKLFWAAKHHSRYCMEHNGGKIAHVIQGEPRGATPGERMVYEGYTGPGGENIHMHSAGPTPDGAHDGWIHSSGHHRNILNPMWVCMGNGKFNLIWTQLFGALDEGPAAYASRGGQ